MLPGSRQLTLIFKEPRSCASALLKPTKAALLVVYGTPHGSGASAKTDAVLTMEPPPLSVISGTAALQQKNVPSRLVASKRRHVSTVVSGNRRPSPPIPALLTSTSKEPKRSA